MEHVLFDYYSPGNIIYSMESCCKIWQESFSPSVMPLTKCIFLMLGTLSKSCKLKYPFAQSNVSKYKNLNLYLKWNRYSERMTSVRDLIRYFREWTTPVKCKRPHSKIPHHIPTVLKCLSACPLSKTVTYEISRTWQGESSWPYLTGRVIATCYKRTKNYCQYT